MRLGGVELGGASLHFVSVESDLVRGHLHGLVPMEWPEIYKRDARLMRQPTGRPWRPWDNTLTGILASLRSASSRRFTSEHPAGSTRASLCLPVVLETRTPRKWAVTETPRSPFSAIPRFSMNHRGGTRPREGRVSDSRLEQLHTSKSVEPLAPTTRRSTSSRCTCHRLWHNGACGAETGRSPFRFSGEPRLPVNPD